MKLGIAYNAFDGLELLEASIDSVRDVADYIVVVYQEVSNFGNKADSNAEALITKLFNDGKIDDMVKYEPVKLKKGHGNEVDKRNLGISLCEDVNCTHFMTMDVDELYDKHQLSMAKLVVGSDGLDSTGCKMLTYYRSGNYILDPPEEYYVPLIYRIDRLRRFNMNNRWPVPVDPTRRLEPKKIRLFDRSEIQMHHFSYVRKDIRAKLNNSSASVNFSNRIEEIARYYEHWTPGMKALLAGKEERYYDLKTVENKFKINDMLT